MTKHCIQFNEYKNKVDGNSRDLFDGRRVAGIRNYLNIPYSKIFFYRQGEIDSVKRNRRDSCN